MNRFAIELYFDTTTKQHLISLWSELNRAGLVDPLCKRRGYVPHISLLVSDRLQPEDIIPAVRELAMELFPIPITLSHFGFFKTNVTSLWLGPTHSVKLRETHQKVYTRMSDFPINWLSYYSPDLWVPHCSIIADRPFDQCCKVFAKCCDFELPLTGQLESIALVDFIDGIEFIVDTLIGRSV